MKRSFPNTLVTLYLWMGVAYFFLGVITSLGTYPDRFFPVVLNNAWGVIYVTVLNYLFFERTILFLLRKREWLIYNILLGIFVLFIHMILYSYVSYLWRLLGVSMHMYMPLKVYTSLDGALQSQMAYSAGSIFFFAVIRAIYNYIKLRQATQQLRIEKQAAELNYLRSQTNPHFLFNTLNNIYSLARDKNDLAPESILRLSKILRFMLYETSGNSISIEQELKIIDDYIALEGLRYDESLRINFSQDIEDRKQALPPLLLMPLVENAFKHGVSETRGQPFIDIQISIRNRRLLFVVKNSSEQYIENVKENIGLANLRRQLQLLYTDYELSVQPTTSLFTATLKINLASHV